VRLSPAVHFVGISGIGMSALARVLLQRGYSVTGSSDRRTDLTDRLESEGARVFIGHAAANVGGAGTIVVSTAIAANNPELVAARDRDIEIVHRGALLARLMHDRRGIAIAGTHGKTTTTAMTGRVLESGGLDPTVIVGGERLDTLTNASDGKGAWLVSEADESDMSFLDLRPEIAVVTNVENDHISSDAELPRLIAAFEGFVRELPRHGLALFGIDEPRAASLAERSRSSRTQTFGFTERANVRAVRATYRDFGSRFDVLIDDALAGEIVLTVPGAINVLDALPAVAIGLELGVPFRTIARALAGFRGVRRRFEILARTPRMTLVDDYAHHPTAVAATIAAARENFSGPIVVAFQPHRYTRTQYLAGEFARALRGADRVILTDVYAASEAPLPGVDARLIGAPLAGFGNDVAYLGDVAELPGYLLEHAPHGALALVLGAGSITTAAAALARDLRAPVAADARGRA
jgi:UDP-N-acetylmuramate--alanine ligase